MSSKVVRDQDMAVPRRALFRAITEFERYPEFLPEVVGAKVEGKGQNGKVVVQFELELIKRFEYKLEFQVRGENEVEWRLLESDFFKTNEGKWVLKDQGTGKTKVHYELQVGFGFLVPKFVAKKLTEVNLPKMFEAFESRAKQLAAEAK